MEHEGRGLLVVLDGSETSRRALDLAIERARDRGLPVTLLSIVPPRLWRARRGQFQVAPEKHDEEFARTLLAEGKRACKAAGVQASSRLRSGPPAEVILEEASRGFDLVVLGERRNQVGAPTLVSIVKGRLASPLEVVAERP